MAFVKLNPSIWEFSEVGDNIEGTLICIEEDVGINKAMLYSLETSEGVKKVWGSTILDNLMSLVKLNNKVRITYKGLGVKKGSNNAPKIFEVEIDKD